MLVCSVIGIEWVRDGQYIVYNVDFFLYFFKYVIFLNLYVDEKNLVRIIFC